jgi:hypothetical protein
MTLTVELVWTSGLFGELLGCADADVKPCASAHVLDPWAPGIAAFTSSQTGQPLFLDDKG